MRLVENHSRVIRQHASIGAVAQREIGKEEMMIDDDDVRLRRAVAHARNEARIKVGTLLAQTGLRARVDVSPEGKVLRQIRQLCAIPYLGSLDPMTDLFEIIHLIETVENRRVSGAMNPLQTDIVVATFHVRGFEILR